MKTIYEPRGRAREYSPLALNVYNKCDHQCRYCLDGNTLITKSDLNLIKIKDINIGDKIIGLKKDGYGRNILSKYVESIVLNKMITKKQVFLIELENGIKIKCSGDHRWYTERGWKYTMGNKEQRSYLTNNNYIYLLNKNTIYTITDQYKKGYLSGIIKGDGTLKKYQYKRTYVRKDRRNKKYTWNATLFQFLLRLKDNEALLRVKEYLEYFDIRTNGFVISKNFKGIRTNVENNYNRIKKLTEYKEEKEFRRGFLAGIFDAEGSYDDHTIRIANTDMQIMLFIEKALEDFKFKYIYDKKKIDVNRNKPVSAIRIKGGKSENIRFFQTSNTVIQRKRKIFGKIITNKTKVKSIKNLGYEDYLYDIQTTTENFIANGLISHNCYVPIIQKKYGHDVSSSKVYPRRNILTELRKEVYKYSFGKQVLLCFMGDPYCRADVGCETTRGILEILLKNQVTVAILTKGGKRCLRDLDLFRRFDVVKVGATLTLINDADSLKWEPYAALPKDRIETLKKLRENGIKTWVSFEPVIDVKQTLQLIDTTHEFIDQYKVGKMNHYDTDIDWRDFGIKAIEKLNGYGKKFYVKKDLATYIPRGKLTEEQMDMDYLAIRGKG